METAFKLVEVGVIGAGVAAFCWWQFRDLRIEREKAAARAAALPAQSADPTANAGAEPGAEAGVAAIGSRPAPETGRTL
jgi:hypothetical protein